MEDSEPFLRKQLDIDEMTKRERKILNFLEMRAKEVAPVGSARIASAIVLKGEIISIGFNQMKSSPFQANHNSNFNAIYFHSEINAIYNALKSGFNVDDFRHCSIFVVRMKKNISNHAKWEYGMAQPCQCGCMPSIMKYDFKKLIYTTEIGYEEVKLH